MAYAFLALAVVSVILTFQPLPCADAQFVTYRGSGSDLQAFVDANRCVKLPLGDFRLSKPLTMPERHWLVGGGTSQSSLAPAAGFTDRALVVVSESNVHIGYMTVSGQLPDGSQIPLVLVVLHKSTHRVLFEMLIVTDAGCDGISLGGTGSIVRDSYLTNNGGKCDNGVGSAIYATTEGEQEAANPKIEWNVFSHNPGTAIDMNAVEKGRIQNNIILDNGGIAGIAVYRGKSWAVVHNTVHDNGGYGNPGHPECHFPVKVGLWGCHTRFVQASKLKNLNVLNEAEPLILVP